MGRGRGQNAAADDRLCVFPVFTDDVKRKNDTFHTEINKAVRKCKCNLSLNSTVSYICACAHTVHLNAFTIVESIGWPLTSGSVCHSAFTVSPLRAGKDSCARPSLCAPDRSALTDVCRSVQLRSHLSAQS